MERAKEIARRINEKKGKGNRTSPMGVPEACGTCVHFPNIDEDYWNCDRWEKGKLCEEYKYRGHYVQIGP